MEINARQLAPSRCCYLGGPAPPMQLQRYPSFMPHRVCGSGGGTHHAGGNETLYRAFAGATSALVTYPLDLARARLAVGHARKLGGRRRTMGVPELLRTVVRQDGFQALYRGVTPSLLGIIPYAGIAFSINEQAKHKVVVLTGKEPGTFHKLGIGALAGLIAQSCTYPLEVTRRRMQTHGLVDTQAGVKKAVFQEQGAAGLFKGLSMNWVKGPVGISISFTTFDFLKRQLGIS